MVARRSASTAQRVDINPERDPSVPNWAHPEVRFFWRDWRLIRDCVEGERDIKDGGEWYLTKLEGMDALDYDAYLDRATFYNFTGRTLAALTGTIFRRKMRFEGLPSAVEARLPKLSKTGASFETYARAAIEEYLTTGRFGTLVDLPATPTSTPQPYLVPYVAENIIDWEYDIDPQTGMERLSKVILREFVRGTGKTWDGRAYYSAYRVLAIENGIYVQRTYRADNQDAVPDGEGVVTTPQIRGEPLRYIPFYIFGAPRPPLLDIARLNISHYRSYAHLEHGRFFTGLPVYYAEVPQGSTGGNYYLGPANVWELAQGARAGIIEFNGTGLGSLERALAGKEAQAASLGGRMIGVTAQSTAETDNQTHLKDRNEQALLHTTAHLFDEGFTVIMTWFCDFANETTEDLRVIFNKSFLAEGIGSREFRAIQSMYADGILPIEIVHDYLVKAGVISDEIDVDMLKDMLESAESFPNNPDFQARKEGYPNAQAKISAENKQRELDIDEDTLEADIEQADLDRKSEEKKAKDAAKAAAAAPRVEPGVAAQRGQLRQQPRPVAPARPKK